MTQKLALQALAKVASENDSLIKGYLKLTLFLEYW